MLRHSLLELRRTAPTNLCHFVTRGGDSGPCCRVAARPYDRYTALCDTTRIVVQCTGGGVKHDAEDPRVLLMQCLLSTATVLGSASPFPCVAL